MNRFGLAYFVFTFQKFSLVDSFSSFGVVNLIQQIWFDIFGLVPMDKFGIYGLVNWAW